MLIGTKGQPPLIGFTEKVPRDTSKAHSRVGPGRTPIFIYKVALKFVPVISFSPFVSATTSLTFSAFLTARSNIISSPQEQ